MRYYVKHTKDIHYIHQGGRDYEEKFMYVIDNGFSCSIDYGMWWKKG